MNGYWEPWSPEIGQRVRFRRSAECPVHTGGLKDGMTGQVYWVEFPYSENGKEPGHRFWVEWEGGHTTYSAAIELEPLP